MVSEAEPPVQDLTTKDLRARVRRLIESDTGGGYHPLRKYEKHRAYYCLTGEKLDGDPSNGKVSYRLLEYTANGPFDTDVELRDPFDCGGPLTKPELQALVRALEEAADDQEADDEG